MAYDDHKLAVLSMSDTTWDVFISFSTKNKERAIRAKSFLSGCGLRCWFAPDSISGGADWSEEIAYGLKNSAMMVLLWSTDAMQSVPVQREIQYAFNHNKPIIPFRLDEVDPQEGIKYLLGNTQYIDAFVDFETSLEHLAERVKHYRGQGTSNGGQEVVNIVGPTIGSTTGSSGDSCVTGNDKQSRVGIGEVKVDPPAISPRSDLGKLMEALSNYDIFAGDAELKQRLRWEDKKFDKVKAEALGQGLIVTGSGRGGSIAIATPELRQLVQQLTDESSPGNIFLNIGESKQEGDTNRDWGRCVAYGYVSAGHGSKYSNDMKRIKPGAVVFAYSSGSGYVGMGTALENAVPIRDFLIDGKHLQDVLPPDLSFFHHLDDLEMCEWLVRVRWDKTLEREQAVYRTGLFVYVATSCRIKDAITVQYLRSRFNSLLEAPTLSEADRMD